MKDGENHYVLGYGISQAIPHPVTGIPAFYPAKFYLSTTPNKNSPGQATVNFCIINGDYHDENLVDPTKNLNAGILSEPLVDLTRGKNAKNKDGILGMSNNIFFKHWIVPTIFDGLGGTSPGSALKMPLASQSSRNTGGKGSRYATQYSDWVSEWVGDDSQRLKNSGEGDVPLFPHLLIFS